MPWCDECDRFLSPSTVLADGSCPTCHRSVDPGQAQPAEVLADAVDDEPFAMPWHLWLLLAALALYLGYRAFQGLEWVFGF